jgi:hypothetical protein
MSGMPSLRVDKWLSVGAGFGLLLLLSAQQRLCPWLTATPPAEPGTEATPARGAQDAPDTADRTPRKRAYPRLPYLLPGSNTATPRSTAGWSQAALRLRNGWHDGVCSCGPQQPLIGASTAPVAIPPDRLAWHCFQQLATPAVAVTQRTERGSTDPAVATAIARTGPPRA